MKKPIYSGLFKRDLKRAEKRGKDMAALRTVLRLLIEGEPIPAAYKDHPLKGNGNITGACISSLTGC